MGIAVAEAGAQDGDVRTCGDATKKTPWPRCPQCDPMNTTGPVPRVPHEVRACAACHGSGVVRDAARPARDHEPVTCELCEGFGVVDDCSLCGGDGFCSPADDAAWLLGRSRR